METLSNDSEYYDDAPTQLSKSKSVKTDKRRPSINSTLAMDFKMGRLDTIGTQESKNLE